MIWVPDATGRFRERPHYQPDELDVDCEATIEDVLLKRHGRIDYPVSTEDLFFMLEQVACVDAYADFDQVEGDVWGESEFLPGEQPRVGIWRELTEKDRYENPLRTTITHEFTHVRHHGPLFELHRSQAALFGDNRNKTWICKREQVEGHGKPDWMEWQAGYCSGALLMPRQALRGVFTHFLKDHNIVAAQVGKGTLEEIELVTTVVKRFEVSRKAATVRLRQLRYLVEGGAGQHTFRP
jgi:hypothetical protein